MAIAEALLTAEEFARLPDNGRPAELVRGRVVEMKVPYPRHGEICARVGYLLSNFIDDKNLGRLVSNDSAIITTRGPDTVRGADVAFYSYANVPKGPLRQGYLQVMPRLVIEVRSSWDRWNAILTKVAEYLNAGVTLVCVLDPDTETACVYHAERPEQIFGADQELTFPEVLGDFRVVVRRLFE